MIKRPKRPRNARKLSTLDNFLASEGKREEFEAVAVKEILAWQIGEGDATLIDVPSPLAGEGNSEAATEKNG
jgi:hypothetical protein